MPLANFVKQNRYQDSVTLMQVAARLREIPGVEDASLMMGTEPNLEMLDDAGLLSPEGAGAHPNDLIVALRGSDDVLARIERELEDLLRAELPQQGKREREEPHTVSAGLQSMPDANLALISTPGVYAASEARKALGMGLHVMIFSDNVSLDDEAALKREASRRGLLMMGPDCGTAIIGGAPLGFANSVLSGSIGVVGASGTGMQEVTSLVDRYGAGVSHAIGTGSHDLSERIGGAMTLLGMHALASDPSTRVIVVVSKPPHPAVAERVLRAAQELEKPVVITFLGSSLVPPEGGNVRVARTLEDAARQAVVLCGGNPPSAWNTEQGGSAEFQRGQRYLRGLFSGGTFCYEALLILGESIGPVLSNAPLSPEYALPLGLKRGRANSCIDLGADEFTVGRPHPMIDPSLRAERILLEASDPEVAVILLDIVLGYGSHPDPAGALVPVILQAQEEAHNGGRSLVFVASVCGTGSDPQGYGAQAGKLRDAGVILAESNAAAAQLAGRIVSRLSSVQ